MAAYKKSIEMRNNILRAMEHLVLENGYKKTGVKDIAEYLEIPRSLIYYYFDHKHSIMRELYAKKFKEVGQAVSTVLPRGSEPVVRLMLGYLIFQRKIAWNPLFTEFIVLEPNFPALDKDELAGQLIQYYDDSRDVFTYYGKPTDGKDLLLHAIILESVGRALITSKYHGLLELSEYELMECIGERVVIPTFNLSKAELKVILDRTFALADEIKDEQRAISIQK